MLFKKSHYIFQKVKTKKPSAEKVVEDPDLYKRTMYQVMDAATMDPPFKHCSFHQVTPSKRQLKRGGSPSKSVIDTAKVKNNVKVADKTKKAVAKVGSKPTAVKEKTAAKKVDESNSRSRRAERRVSFEVSEVEQQRKSSREQRSPAAAPASKRVSETESGSGERASKRQKEAKKAAEPTKKTDVNKNQRRERLLFGEESSSSSSSSLSKPIKLHLTIDLEMEEEQFVRIAKQLPALLNMPFKG